MMSQHFNSMLEHLKMGSLMKSISNTTMATATATPNASTSNAGTPHDPSSGTSNNNCLKEMAIGKNQMANTIAVNDTDTNRCNTHATTNGSSSSSSGNSSSTSDVKFVAKKIEHFTNLFSGGGGGGGGGGTQNTMTTQPASDTHRSSITSVSGACVTATLTGNMNTLSEKSPKKMSAPIIDNEKFTKSTGVGSRELSPGPRATGQRKLSQDLRRTSGFCANDSGCGGGGDGLDNATAKANAVISRPIKLKTISTKAETYDGLHTKAIERSLQCTKEVCLGSVMIPYLVGLEPRKAEQVLEQAKDFLDQYFTSIRRLKSPAHEARWQQVRHDIETTGSYNLTETELIYGSKLAWRNAYRCIGRIQWSKLQVFDCRYVTTTSGMFEAICNHIKYATNKGNLRSAITIFPQRTDGRHDYRIWNNQLISYAGYRKADGSFIGDPITAEFTEFCMKLGWKPKMTPWDILPLVLSANGHDPDYFEYPPELILEVEFSHPTFKWFADMNLRWFAMPAVSGMMFDCGGIQFCGTAFSGWYMVTEIACRNLCDINRRNILETVAIKMGLDTRTTSSLWKDKALVEINIAVMYSFQRKNITIVDHHTASESFMKHIENESKLRNGCPADWAWIVPPMSASTMQVYHQEMALYYLRPSFEYQEPAIKTHIWKKGRDASKSKKPRRKFHFKQIARAVKFTSKLFGRALSRRIKATVLYATETGKSEQYAKQLCELLGHAFNAQIYCLSDYDITSIEHEALLFVVASTFGNGDAPENGESFAQDLYSMKLVDSGESANGSTGIRMRTTSKAYIRANSRNDLAGRAAVQQVRKIDRLDSLRGSSVSDAFNEETFGPLSNVRFAVFALGSSAYPNFCAYGKYIDNILHELGGERLVKLTTGDEMCGQEQEFRKWAPEVFKLACDTFCLDHDETIQKASFGLKSESLTAANVRFALTEKRETLDNALGKFFNKQTKVCKLKQTPRDLHSSGNTTGRSTILVEMLSDEVSYDPGDHVGIFPANRKEIVDGVLQKLCGCEDPDEIVQLELLREKQNANGTFKTWEPHERLPACSLRMILTRFLDITTPPSRQLLTLLASCCGDKDDEARMNLLASETSEYEDWRHWRMPHLLEVLEEFPSCKPAAGVLITHLMPLQPRFYSISSSQRKHLNEIHLTVAVVQYITEDGKGVEHYGVCSTYLKSLGAGDDIHLFVRNAQSFHIPRDLTRPIILIGPGTGIAPFRSFWQEFEMLRTDNANAQIPKVWLFFGCQSRELDLYSSEKRDMLERGILDRVFLALSRDEAIPKTYVQDLALKEAASIYDIVVNERGHVYVCGDCTMAEHVYQTIRRIIATKERKTENEVEKFMLSLRDENRYHEDIFGITLRTAEIHNKSRATARRIQMEAKP